MSVIDILKRACGVVCIAALTSTCSSKSAQDTAHTMPASAPAPHGTVGAPISARDNLRLISSDLPLLPPGSVAAVRPPAVTKAVYAFAARRPDVLRYMPCFCGCERGGHQGNHDCFVAGRNAQGQVTAWDAHGIGCDVCIDVGQQAMQMTNSGASVSAIRDAIEKKYAGATYKTPTPTPHKGGAH